LENEKTEIGYKELKAKMNKIPPGGRLSNTHKRTNTIDYVGEDSREDYPDYS
jgi:hypothetical protein